MCNHYKKQIQTDECFIKLDCLCFLFKFQEIMSWLKSALKFNHNQNLYKDKIIFQINMHKMKLF